LELKYFRAMLGITLVVIGFYLPKIQEWIPDWEPRPDVPLLAIEKPNEEIRLKTLTASEKITDSDDRVSLCIFNKVFSDRVKGYDLDLQELNDIYTQAGKIVFEDSLRGKYDGYGSSVVLLISDITGEDNHQLTQEEKEDISKVFNGLSWNLLN